MTVFLADPNAVLDYTIDWIDWLQDGETIEAAEWTITAGIVDTDPGFDPDGPVTIWLTGGTIGTTYPCTAHTTTTEGRQDERTIHVRVIDR